MEQAFAKVKTALAAAGARFDQVSITVQIVDYSAADLELLARLFRPAAFPPHFDREGRTRAVA